MEGCRSADAIETADIARVHHDLASQSILCIFGRQKTGHRTACGARIVDCERFSHVAAEIDLLEDRSSEIDVDGRCRVAAEACCENYRHDIAEIETLADRKRETDFYVEDKVYSGHCDTGFDQHHRQLVTMGRTVFHYAGSAPR